MLGGGCLGKKERKTERQIGFEGVRCKIRGYCENEGNCPRQKLGDYYPFEDATKVLFLVQP